MRMEAAKGSWLLAKRPPGNKKPPTGELRLWWSAIRRAARDLRYGHESEAIDALEFLKDTGLWLTTTLFHVEARVYQLGVAALVAARNRETCRELPINSP